MPYDPKAALAQSSAALAFSNSFIGAYLTPAFGAMSKSEIDLLVFSSLIAAGAIAPDGPLYDIARALNITPAKVRGLVMNWQLRFMPKGGDSMHQALVEALLKTRFSKDGTLMTFGVESPLLKEEILARLKVRGVFADTSFSPELVRLPVDAFVEILDVIVSNDVKRALKKALVEDKQLPDLSLKALAIDAVAAVGKQFGGEVLSDVIKAVGDKATATVIAPAVDKAVSFLSGILQGDAKKAVATLDETLFETSAPVLTLVITDGATSAPTG
jgi:hypothetical protein